MTEPRGHAISRLLRRFLLASALLVLACWALLPRLSGLPVVRRWAEEALSGATRWDARIGSLRLGHDLSLAMNAVSLAAPSEEPFLTIERVRISLQPGAALRGRPLTVDVEEPHLYLARVPWRAGEAGAGASPRLRGPIPLGRTRIVDGYVHIRREPEGAVVGPFTLTVESVQRGEKLGLSGATALFGDAGTAEWSARLGTGLADSEASLTAEIPRAGDLLRTWSDVELPSALAGARVSLGAQLRGQNEDRAGLNLRVSVRPAGEDEPAVLEGRGEIELPARRLVLELSGAGLSWHDEESARAVSGLDLHARIAGAPDEQGAAAEIDLRLRGGEVLWDRFYADLSDWPVRLEAKMRHASETLEVRDLVASSQGIGKIAVSGSRTRLRERWRAVLDIPDTTELFALGVRDPLKEDHPVLERTQVGGHLLGDIEYRREPEARRLEGTIELREGRVSVASPKVEIDGINVQLPVMLVEGRAERGSARSGMVQIGTLSAGGVVASGIAVPLQVEVNHVALSQPVRVVLLGGALDLVRFAARLADGGAPSAEVALAIRQLDLAQISRAAGWPPLSGAVSGEIPSLSAKEGRIRSEGEIQVSAFGGQVRVRKLRVDQLLSPVPTLGLDLDYEDISLGDITRTLAVGRVTGVARGGVRDLAIVNGQPLSFEAWMETVPKAGVSQKISVTAIRQLSILGGAGADPLTQGLLSFFDEYRYAKMGFRCRLQNDRFTLRGVEHFEGQEYLVVGAVMPPRVNVVSHTRVIAFSEMVRRLARIRSL